MDEMNKAGEPFALVGVNYRDKLEVIQKVVKDKGLNWRSFFCGDDASFVELYNVSGFPTVVIIDAEGVVRSVAHRQQDKVIKELLAEMK